MGIHKRAGRGCQPKDDKRNDIRGGVSLLLILLTNDDVISGRPLVTSHKIMYIRLMLRVCGLRTEASNTASHEIVAFSCNDTKMSQLIPKVWQATNNKEKATSLAFKAQMESGITESLFDKCVQDWVEGKKCGGTYIYVHFGGSQKSIIHTRTQMSEGLIFLRKPIFPQKNYFSRKYQSTSK